MHSKEAGSLRGCAEAQARGADGARLHHGRVALLLHLHHLHAEVPGEHGAHGRQDREHGHDRRAGHLHVLQPVFGALSDRIGRRNNMLLFSGLATLASVPC